MVIIERKPQYESGKDISIAINLVLKYGRCRINLYDILA